MAVRIITKRTGSAGSVVSPAATRKMAIVAATAGQETLVTEAVVGAGTSGQTGSARIDQVAQSAIRRVVQVADVSAVTSEVYVKDVDFTVDGKRINWSNAPLLQPPDLNTPTFQAATGGVWAAGETGTSIQIKVTATAKDVGETTPSAIATYTLTGGANTFQISWGKVVFSGGYKIYMKTTGATFDLLATITTSTTVSYVVTGSSTTATNPPSTNTCYKRPGTGDTYYAKYYYPSYTYTRELFTNYGDLQSRHGIGSDLSNAARLAFQDNGAPQVYAVGVSADTIAAYQAAIDQLASVSVQYITAMKSGSTIEQYLKAKSEYYSADDRGLERTGIVAAPSGYTLGDTSTAGTILYWLNSMGNSKRMIAAVPNKCRYYVNTWQTTGGTLQTGPYEVAHYFYAAAVAGAICALADSATPLTNSQIYGFTWPASLDLWVDADMEQLVEAGGGTYVGEESAQHIVYHGISCDTTSVEDQEISIIAAEDEMRTRLRAAMGGFRGKDRKITVSRLNAIAARTQDVLGYMVKNELIVDFGTIQVTQDENDATKIYIRFNYGPMYPMNQLVFEYSFSTAPLSAAA